MSCIKRTTGKDGNEYTFFYTKAICFSNFWKCEKLEINGISFSCTEQYFMHQKAVIFGDKPAAFDILKAKTPMEMKKIGRKVKGFDAQKWNKEGVKAMIEGNVHKYLQNEKLRKELLETAGSILVESSPRDRIWGIGMSLKNPSVLDPKKWRGKNLLGKILTEIRECLLTMDSSDPDAIINVVKGKF